MLGVESGCQYALARDLALAGDHDGHHVPFVVTDPSR